MKSPFDFDVGDHVQIRDRNDMEAEYGRLGGVIRTPYWTFTAPMHKLCGMDFHIASIESNDGHIYYRSEEGIENKDDDGMHIWYITPYMVRLVDEPESDCEVDLDRWASVLAQ